MELFALKSHYFSEYYVEHLTLCDHLLRNLPSSLKHQVVRNLPDSFDERHAFILLTGIRKYVYSSVYEIDSNDYVRILDKVDVAALLTRLHCQGVFFLTHDDSRYIVGIFSPEDTQGFDAVHAARVITDDIQQIYESEIFRGDTYYANVSALVPVMGGIDGIHAAYKHACTLCDLSFFHMQPEVITDEWVSAHRGDADYHTIIDRLEQFKAALIQGDEAAARAYLQTLFLHDLKQSFSRPLCVDALSYLKHTLDLLVTVYQSSAIADLDALCSVDSYLRIEECFEAIDAILSPLCCEIRSGGAYLEPILRAINYIHHHYQNPDLAQPDVAIYAGVHPNYLSVFFKEQTGSSIRQVITSVRLQKACHLLAHTDARIHDISNRVGIRDVRYFRQLFEQKMGLSPNAYREQQAKKR